ncbi:MAG: histidinol-phosphate aminotransferase [Gammaproteobacteria bacterium BRH_c0]|nr:MAG: histidinol-phosphate aminotransferase [Gammaproteobacteria bacterium BRH_c0]
MSDQLSDKYWSDLVRGLDPYVPGEQPKIDNLVKLNTNENPYGPSPRVLAAINAATGDNLRLYPPPDSDLLKEALARYHSLDKDQVFVGNGSDEVLAHVFQAFFSGRDNILFPDITYSFYPVYCGLYGIGYETIPLAEDFTLAVAGYRRPNGGVIFPNPNAPTGIGLPLAEIEALLAANTGSVVVVDEAYVDFGAESAVSLISRYPNLLVVQTLSKSRSLAGLRVGFALGDAGLIEALERIKNSFNSYPLDQLAIAGAAASFEDEAYFQHTRATVMESRRQLSDALAQRGFNVLPSSANFVFARHPDFGGADLAGQLRQRGVVVRHFNKPRIDAFLRITVGTNEQQQRLIAALDEILGS